MIAPIAFVFGLLSLVSAIPIDKRIVPISQCTTIATGTLRTTNGHKLHLASGNTLSFGTSGLEVKFQSCQPNFGRFSGENGTPVGGHIVVKSTGKCLSLKPGFTGPPFAVTVDDCYYSDDSGQTFSNFVKQSDGKIYFVGGTQADKSYIWYGEQCASGYFGVSSSATHGPAELTCVKKHVVGFNI